MPTSVSPNRSNGSSVGPQTVRTARTDATSRRRIGAAVFILALSAVVFCMAVVRQRDVRLKQVSLSHIREVESWVRNYYEEHGFLPASLPPDQNFFDGQAPYLAYPDPRQVPNLNHHKGPIILISAPLMGMITPGGDGHAALVIENGQLHSEWISPEQLFEMRQARRDLLAGS